MKRSVLIYFNPLFFLLFLLMLITIQCASVKHTLFGPRLNKNNEPFRSYQSYTQEDIYVFEKQNDHEKLLRNIIAVLNEMSFPVDSCVTTTNKTFIKTAFVFKKKQFPTPKHQYLKISLLLEVPEDESQVINIKHAICTTCARCEEWYCDQLPAWAYQEEYNVIPRVQQLIFDFKKRLSQSVE